MGEQKPFVETGRRCGHLGQMWVLRVVAYAHGFDPFGSNTEHRVFPVLD